MFKTTFIVLLFVFTFYFQNLFSQSWNMIHKSEIGTILGKGIFIDDNLLVLITYEGSSMLYDIKTYDINRKNWQQNLITEANWSDEKSVIYYNGSTSIYEIYYYDKILFVATGNNSFCTYNFEQDKWNKYYFDDIYNNAIAIENQYYRAIQKVKEYNGKIYCLSKAIQHKKSSNEMIGFIIEKAYNELFVLENNELKLLFKVARDDFSDDGTQFGDFSDFIFDEDGLILIANSGLGNSGLIQYDGNFHSINLLQSLGFKNGIISGITYDGNNIYVVKQAASFNDALLIKYNIITKEISNYLFAPRYNEQTQTTSYVMDFRKIEYINGKVYIIANNGLWFFEKDSLEHIDIFTQFNDELPEDYKKLRSITDFSWYGSKICFITTPGLIFSGDFFITNVHDIVLHTNLKVYPNIINEIVNTINIEFDNINTLLSLEIYNTAGTLIAETKELQDNVNQIFTINLPVLNSGYYFIKISTITGEYIRPIIISK